MATHRRARGQGREGVKEGRCRQGDRGLPLTMEVTMARKPAEVFPPGEYIKDELDARAWSQAEFAEILGRPPRVVSELINGKRTITPETAKEIAAAFGSTPELWMNLESAYRLSKTKNDEGAVA